MEWQNNNNNPHPLFFSPAHNSQCWPPPLCRYFELVEEYTRRVHEIFVQQKKKVYTSPPKKNAQRLSFMNPFILMTKSPIKSTQLWTFSCEVSCPNFPESFCKTVGGCAEWRKSEREREKERERERWGRWGWALSCSTVTPTIPQGLAKPLHPLFMVVQTSLVLLPQFPWALQNHFTPLSAALVQCWQVIKLWPGYQPGYQ